MKKYMGVYSRKQIGFIIGMLLGDGYISKYLPKRANSFIGCRHSKKQKEYLLFKKNRLEQLGFKVSRLYDTTSYAGETFTFECRDPKLCNQLRLVLYPKNNKTIKRKWLNYMSASDLAIWYMDDGSLTKRGKSAYSSLHTNGFNKKEHDVLIKYFKQVWGISPTLRVVKRSDRHQSYFLTFSVEETKKFLKIVKPHVIDAMSYKVDFNFKEQPN
jgi:intein-encoded DNA endonuclease-like protein